MNGYHFHFKSISMGHLFHRPPPPEVEGGGDEGRGRGAREGRGENIRVKLGGKRKGGHLHARNACLSGKWDKWAGGWRGLPPPLVHPFITNRKLKIKMLQ